MKYRIGITLLGFLVVALLGLPTAVNATIDQDDLGAVLAQPDGSWVSIPCIEILWAGRSKKSFGVKEFGEQPATPGYPRLVVVSTKPLPVSSYWNCDIHGILDTYSGISRRDGKPFSQRVLVVSSPDNVLIYCSPKGYPQLFPPLKSLDIDWPYKRTLTDLANEREGATASVTTMEEESLPPMPDSPYSMEPIYCATIADARAQYSPTARNLVELHCRPFSNATATQFDLGQDSPSDSITVFYSGSSTLSGRINKIVGTIQKDEYDTYWIEVDSGPNWQEGDDVGGVQAVPEGSIVWAKTFPDGAVLPSGLSDKVVSRMFPNYDYFYIQEPGRSAGIRVMHEGLSVPVQPGDVVSLPSDAYNTTTISTVDGERVLTSSLINIGSPTTAPGPLGVNNRAKGAGYNVHSQGAVGASGLSTLGLLVRAWGQVTDVGLGYFYIDDGSGVTDGTESTGVRVVGLDGYQPYVPAIGDYVAVTGVSGLGLYNEAYGLARTVRVASSSDLTVFQPVGPPTGVQVLATGVDQNDLGKITVYWNGVPGATGYNVYRGTTSGGEDYNTPLNGAQPITTPTYTGSNKYAFTNTGLSFGQEYFYTVKAVRSYGESAPSDEDSDIPDGWAIPWDSDDAYAITAAVEAISPTTGAPDLVRAVGPDGTVYCSWYGVMRPGSADIGTLEPGTNTVRYSDGSTLTIPDDSGMLGVSTEESGMQLLIAPTELNNSDGPYRRVRSIATCTGGYATFAPGWSNQIHMSVNYPNDTYWTYLGHRKETTVGGSMSHLGVRRQFWRPPGFCVSGG